MGAHLHSNNDYAKEALNYISLNNYYYTPHSHWQQVYRTDMRLACNVL